MENKYYTPEIEEFHVGFEFEMDDTWGGWKKLILTDEMLKGNVMIGLGSGNERVPYYHKTRVKYLDREDIESLGFVENAWSLVDSDWKMYDLGKYLLSHGGGNNYSITIPNEGIQTEKGFMHHTVFRGTIKNKSELKRLLKQLGI